jgi:predicted GNAT family acetyltransferase
MADVTVTHVPGTEGIDRLVARADAEELGYMEVRSVHDEGFIVDHTVVRADVRRRGVGETLFSHVVQKARNEGRYVVPICSFVLSRFEKYADTNDVRATSRQRLASGSAGA